MHPRIKDKAKRTTDTCLSWRAAERLLRGRKHDQKKREKKCFNQSLVVNAAVSNEALINFLDADRDEKQQVKQRYYSELHSRRHGASSSGARDSNGTQSFKNRARLMKALMYFHLPSAVNPEGPVHGDLKWVLV
ncbi:hypothetical protein E2C01_088665 [Portunus trituberculatus]|uniref:Uncharacterized protein n=1 Tax=Portunus trituberculatus TaxID=210409 RepID=A0A5B7JBC8_PORTR|nr:hypothetical protein [Portunus trituberculatus]